MDTMTWAELVKEVMDTIVNEGAASDNDIEKIIYQKTAEKCKDHFNTISLARIATALYKIAGLEDEFTEDTIMEDLKYE